MKALVYYGPGNLSWEERAEPVITHPADVIIRVDAATICGTDAHITHGVHPEVVPGTVLGHEAVGTITEVGPDVTRFKVGDHVVVPPITSCGTCSICVAGLSAHCQTLGANGWQLGHEIDGLQADYARIPFADHSLHLVPAGVPDEEAILAVDVFAAAYEMGIVAAEVKQGDTVVIIGDGPIGLAAVLLARLENAATVIAVGIRGFRLDIATQFGADHVVNSAEPGWVAQVRALCPGGGADAIIEAVGAKETLEGAFALVNVFGRIANIGVHTEPVSLPIDELWIKGVTIRSGMISCTSTPKTLQLQSTGHINAAAMVSHRLPMAEAIRAYQVFDDAAATRATKVVLLR